MRELITCLHLRSKKLACPQSMRVLTAFTLLLIAGQATAGEQVISVQHDSSNAVTCWIIEGTGISCLSDSAIQQATPSSKTERASQANSEREDGALQAAPLPANRKTLPPEQDQDGPTPAAAPTPRSNEERFQL